MGTIDERVRGTDAEMTIRVIVVFLDQRRSLFFWYVCSVRVALFGVILL